MATLEHPDSPTVTGPSVPGPRLFAAMSLLAANVGFLALFIALDLTLFQLVFVYWLELLWIGLFSGLKLVTASLFGRPYENRWVDVSRGAALFTSLFAIVKSAGLFFTLLGATGIGLILAHESMSGIPAEDFVAGEASLLLKCSVLFLAGHALSFVINFLALGEFRHARAVALLWLPFQRGLALLIIVAGGLAAIVKWPNLFSATGFALALILVKLAADWLLHARERQTLAQTRTVSA